MDEQTKDEIRSRVRKEYAATARGEASACSPWCCGGNGEASRSLGYSAADLDAVPEGANLGLGLTLTDLEGLSQRDAAAMLGLSLSGMKSRVHRARRQLRAALESCCRIALDGHGQVIGYEPRSGEGLPPGCSC